jgi:hypothetical protein
MYMSFLGYIPYDREILRAVPWYCDVRTRSTASRNVDVGTRYVTVYVVSLVAGRIGGKRDNDNKRYTMKVPAHVCLSRHIYMSDVNKVQPIRVKMIRIAAICLTCICVTKDIYMIRYFHP